MRYGFVITKKGTFGVVERCYTTEAGVPCVLVRTGFVLTPVVEEDCKQLSSRYEREARAEAKKWLEANA